MKKFLAMSAALALVAACDQRPAGGTGGGGGDGGDTDPPPVGAGTLAVGQLNGATFDQGELVVTVVLDGTDERQVYAQAGTVGAYDRYDQQETDINRAFTAVAAENTAGTLLAVVAMDGGQFNRFFGGALIEQDAYSAPAPGFYYYTGDYSGLLNFGGTSAGGADTPPSVSASNVGTVTGQVYLLADFVDNNVEGVVYDRVAEIFGDSVDLGDLVMIFAQIGDDGTFAGTLELNDLTGAGNYVGAFDVNAENVAGLLAAGPELMTDATIDDATLGVIPYDYETSGFEQEYGVFLIGQCPGGADGCFGN